MSTIVILIFIIITYHTSDGLAKIFILGGKKNGNLRVMFKKMRDESSKKGHLLYNSLSARFNFLLEALEASMDLSLTGRM